MSKRQPIRVDRVSDVRRALSKYFQANPLSTTTATAEEVAMKEDLKECLGLGSEEGKDILTERQRICIIGCLVEGKTEAQLAQELNIKQQSINANVRAGVKRLADYLYTGKVVERVFEPGESEEVARLFLEGKTPKEIACILNKRTQSIRNKIKQLRAKGKLPQPKHKRREG